MERDFKGVWIPKEVWLAEDLSWTEKNLYVEIDSLARNNECFATNEYFAQFFRLKKDTISKAVSSLKNKGYVDVVLQYKENTKQIEKRIIIPLLRYRRKILEGVGEKSDTPVGKKSEDNNTEVNNTVIKEKKNTKEKPTVEVNFDAFVQIYRDICIGFPGIRSITAQRKKAIKKFLEEHTVEEFKEICQKAIASDFLTGKSTGFKADFDFLIKPDKAIKTLEGTYDNSPAQQQKQQKQPRTNKFQNFEERNYDFEKLEAAMEAENEREYQKTIQAKLNKDIGFEIADGVTGNFKPQQQAQTNNSFINTLRNDYGRKDTSNATIRQFT